MDDILNFLKGCFIFLIHILNSLVVLAETAPIANVNRNVFVNLHSLSQFVTTCQPIADWRLLAINL